MSATQEISWVRPSEHDADRPPEDVSPVIDTSTETPEVPVPVGAGRMRGLVLHKLIEEVLTGEAVPEEVALTSRAEQLVAQLLGENSSVLETPEAGEFARTVVRTLALPEIAAMELLPEVAIYGMKSVEPRVTALAGRAGAVVFGADRASIVVDWKSDTEERYDAFGSRHSDARQSAP